jgi:hypothetical protein
MTLLLYSGAEFQQLIRNRLISSFQDVDKPITSVSINAPMGKANLVLTYAPD